MKVSIVYGVISVIIIVIVVCFIIDCVNCRMLEGSFLFKYFIFLENIFRKVFFFLFLKCWIDVLSSVEIVLLWMCMDD